MGDVFIVSSSICASLMRYSVSLIAHPFLLCRHPAGAALSGVIGGSGWPSFKLGDQFVGA